jgi:CRP/FNR family cyclic AMP-dependent transcriptional regulator
MHPLPIPLPLGSNNVPRHALLRRVPGASSMVVPAGEILVREGEPSESVFAIDRGAVALSSTCSGGRTAMLEILGPGDSFGFEALIPGDAGPGLWPEARSLVASRTVAVSIANLRAARAQTPLLDEWVMGAMALRLQRLGTSLLRSLTLPVVEHVQLVLADLAMVHGSHVAEGLRIELPLSQEAVASLVGSTRESVNRAMHSLVQQGLVCKSGRRYVLTPGWDAHSTRTSPNRRSGP